MQSGGRRDYLEEISEVPDQGSGDHIVSTVVDGPHLAYVPREAALGAPSAPAPSGILSFGAAYGLLLYGIMNYAVVPLSAARPGSKDPLWVVLSVVVHVLLIGIPIAVIARPVEPGLLAREVRPH